MLHQDDRLREECGVTGISNHWDAAALTALCLHALQHRGQESCGILSYHKEKFYAHKGLGHVSHVFNNAKNMETLQGQTAIGHVRYATSGERSIRNIQPLYAPLAGGGFGLCHNGNLTNALYLKEKLINKGAIFHSTSDTEVVIHLIALSEKNTFYEKFVEAIEQIQGAFSFIALHKDILYGLRDARGFRPLVLGKLDDSYILTSETCALDIISATYVRDILPGEMVVIHHDHIESFFPFRKEKETFCVFEYIYFSRPDSFINQKNIYDIRKNIGHQLAKEQPVDADIIIPIPDSGVPAAIGYSQTSHIPFEMGIIRNHYVGRTFIQPSQEIRNFGVRKKHNLNRPYIKDKRIILIDDSIVRGTTSKRIIEMLRHVGAKEIHIRISSPPIISPCYFGIDTPDTEHLIAANKSLEEMRLYLKADSLYFVSLPGLFQAIHGSTSAINVCHGCLTKNYPLNPKDLEHTTPPVQFFSETHQNE